ncbi:uncharacterized protein LTR77_004026 [Saxophila tyrrhenica]|uniref:DUF1996 domain-containing protein n=1 Tax=Saxophila tyrrhenica TaxID=1690608 RepID=A0AAV9PBM5_9PEZI|nr:hypothetical protein LTR77_004026 [Saxophila tyrrhenica]
MKSFALAASAATLLSQVQAAQFVMYTGSTESNGDDNVVERADPILAPGVLSQHVHQIFGSDGFAPGVTYESLQKSSCTNVGASNGDSNMADKSIYWHPALYAEASDNSGYIRIPTMGHKFYYKDVGSDMDKLASPFEFPHGFRMLAGNPFMRVAASDLQQQNVTQWMCHDSSGSNQGTDGGFPDGVTDCDAYPGFNGAIHFPHCWNGDDFNPADPAAHMSYPEGDVQSGPCPKSHPTRLPHIFVENQFDVHGMAGKFKTDTFTLAMGDPTGYGWHYDFFNGWDDGAIPELFKTCPQPEFGNEDIGSCPSMKRGGATNKCQLKTTFKENIDAPGKYLVGCNPVSKNNPAPMYATSPLGTSSNQCKLASGGPPPSGPSSSSPSESSMAASPSSAAGSKSSSMAPSGTMSATYIQASSSAQATKPMESSTMVTSTKSSSTPSPSTYPSSGSGSDISCPESNHQKYTVNGKTFRVQCGVDHHGGDMKSVTAHSLAECVEACASTDGCVDVSLSGVACYMKSTLGERKRNKGVNGARLVDATPAHKGGKGKPAGYVTNIHTATASPTATAASHHRRHLAKHIQRYAS